MVSVLGSWVLSCRSLGLSWSPLSRVVNKESIWWSFGYFHSFTTKKQTTKFSYANFQKILIPRYSCLSLSRPRLSRPYHLCRNDVRVPYISPIYLLYFNFACLELLLSRHIGYLAHHFRSADIFFTEFPTAYLEPQSMTERRKTGKRNDAAGLLIKDYYYWAIANTHNAFNFQLAQVITIIAILLLPQWNYIRWCV